MANSDVAPNAQRRPAVVVSARPIPLGDERYPEHVFLFRYWNEIRGDRIGPHRSELDPQALKSVLARLTLVERDGARAGFRFRLAGTGIYRLMDREISKRRLAELWPPEYVELLTAHYSAVFDTAQPSAFEIVFLTENDLKRWYATLRLPLSDDGHTVVGLVTVDTFCDRWEDILPYIDRRG